MHSDHGRCLGSRLSRATTLRQERAIHHVGHHYYVRMTYRGITRIFCVGKQKRLRAQSDSTEDAEADDKKKNNKMHA